MFIQFGELLMRFVRQGQTAAAALRLAAFVSDLIQLAAVTAAHLRGGVAGDGFNVCHVLVPSIKMS
jgi:hypothetical protein